MLFNSFQFVFFFTAFLSLYWILPARWFWVWLLLASCVFYGAATPRYLPVLWLLILVDYFGALAMEKWPARKRFFLLASICSNLGLLFFFKYLDFGLSSAATIAGWFGSAWNPTLLKLAVPLGLSFHTFQSLSYVIEVYRGKFQPERHLGTYALYVMFFPQLVAGPIERPQTLLPQLQQRFAFDRARFWEGAQLVCWGYLKKVVIADNLALLADPAFSAPTNHSSLYLLVAALAFWVEIYCDFSGYCDIAAGTAHMMGITLTRNFAMPFGASSVSDFWSRWHISLTSWFRDYLYSPLALKAMRVSLFWFCGVILLTLLVSGLWHGADWHYVVWGGLHGLALSFETVGRYYRLNRMPKWVSWSLTAVFLGVTFIFFRAQSCTDAFVYLRHLFSFSGSGAITEWNVLQIMGGRKSVLAISLMIAGLLVYEIAPVIRVRAGVWETLSLRWNATIWAIGASLIYWLARPVSQPFIYFQF